MAQVRLEIQPNPKIVDTLPTESGYFFLQKLGQDQNWMGVVRVSTKPPDDRMDGLPKESSSR